MTAIDILMPGAVLVACLKKRLTVLMFAFELAFSVTELLSTEVDFGADVGLA